MLKYEFNQCRSERACAVALVEIFNEERTPLMKNEICRIMHDDNKAHGGTLLSESNLKWGKAFNYLLTSGIIRIASIMKKGPRDCKMYSLNMPQEEIELKLGKLSDELTYSRKIYKPQNPVITREAYSKSTMEADKVEKEEKGDDAIHIEQNTSQDFNSFKNFNRKEVKEEISKSLCKQIADLEISKYMLQERINALHKQLDYYGL